MFKLHVFKCTMYMIGSCQSQKRASDSLELELWVFFVSRYVGVLGIEPTSFALETSTFNYRTPSFFP